MGGTSKIQAKNAKNEGVLEKKDNILETKRVAVAKEERRDMKNNFDGKTEAEAGAKTARERKTVADVLAGKSPDKGLAPAAQEPDKGFGTLGSLFKDTLSKVVPSSKSQKAKEPKQKPTPAPASPPAPTPVAAKPAKKEPKKTAVAPLTPEESLDKLYDTIKDYKEFKELIQTLDKLRKLPEDKKSDFIKKVHEVSDEKAILELLNGMSNKDNTPENAHKDVRKVLHYLEKNLTKYLPSSATQVEPPASTSPTTPDKPTTSTVERHSRKLILEKIESFTDSRQFEKYVYQALERKYSLLRKDSKHNWSVTPIKGVEDSEAICKAVITKKAELEEGGITKKSAKKRTAPVTKTHSKPPTSEPDKSTPVSINIPDLDIPSKSSKSKAPVFDYDLDFTPPPTPTWKQSKGTANKTSTDDYEKRSIRLGMPDGLVTAINAKGNSEAKKKDLHFLWRVYKEEDSFPDDKVDIDTLSKITDSMLHAHKEADAHKPPEQIAKTLALALEFAKMGEFAPNKTSPAPTPTSKPASTPTPKPAPAPVAPKKTPVPDHLMKVIYSVAGTDDDKKKKLERLWEVANGKESLNDKKKDKAVKKLMEEANKRSKKGHIPIAEGCLNQALAILETSSPPPNTPSGTPPSGSTGTPPNTPSGGSTSTASKTASKTPVLTAAAKEKAAKAKEKAIEGLLKRMGFPFDKEDPVSIAIKNALEDKIGIEKNADVEKEIEELEAFINNAKYGDAIDAKYGQMKPKEIQKKLDKKIPKLEQLNMDISRISNSLHNKKKPPTKEESKELMTESTPLLKTKRRLENSLKDLNIAFERAVAKENADTTYARSPEQLLGIINIHFAKKAMAKEGKKGTPDYMKIMGETQDQIQKATEELSGKWSKMKNYANPFSYFKPRLTSTLKAIMEGDEILKKITPEQADKLAQAWKTPGAVRNWIRSLEGSEQENMTTVVPAIIGHLSAAVNEGRAARLHPISIGRGRGLLKNMRDAVHQYSIASAEKTSGGSLDKMNAYFGNLNEVNKKASEVNYKVVRNHAWWSMAKNVGATAGIAAGGYGIGWAGVAGYTAAASAYTAAAGASSAAYAGLAGLSGLQMAAVGAGTTATGLTVGSFAVEDPKMKAWMRKSAFRLAAATGLGALTVASIPWAALPSMASGAMAGLSATPWLTVGATAGGFFLPDIWKARKKVAKGGAKVVGGTAYVAGRSGWAYTGAMASLLGFGLPLFSKRYRNFFGMHFRPLLNKIPANNNATPLSRTPANDNATPLSRTPANDNAIPFKQRRADAA